MFIKNAEWLKYATPEPLTHHQVDADGNPIWIGDGKGIDWEQVKR